MPNVYVCVYMYMYMEGGMVKVSFGGAGQRRTFSYSLWGGGGRPGERGGDYFNVGRSSILV